MADTIRYANFRKDDSPGEAFFMGGKMKTCKKCGGTEYTKSRGF